MKNFCLWGIIALVMMALPCHALAGKAPTAGDLLVKMQLNTPDAPDQQAYLELVGKGLFDPVDIPAQLLIIEIFSMYCPHCQREAPAVNRLFQEIEASTALRSRVKLIGIGVGNSTYEVDHFRKHYKIEFPLFPDEDFIIHKELGEVRTPYFIIVSLSPEDRGRVLWTGAGNMDPIETFTKRLNNFIKER